MLYSGFEGKVAIALGTRGACRSGETAAPQNCEMVNLCCFTASDSTTRWSPPVTEMKREEARVPLSPAVSPSTAKRRKGPARPPDRGVRTRLRSHEASAQTGSGRGGRDEEGVRPLLPGGHCSPAAAPSSQVPCSEKRRFRPARLEGVSVEGTSSRQSRRIPHGLRPDRTRSRSAGAAHQAGPKPTAPPCGPSPPLSQRVTLISVRSLKATMWKLVPSACGLEPAPSGVPGSGLRPSSVKGTRRQPRGSSQGPT